MKMDKIILKGLRFSGRHGILPGEKDRPQTFVVDLSLFLNLEMAGRKDSLEDTVDYGEVYLKVKHIVEKNSYNLIETVAEKISQQLLLDFPLIKMLETTVYKPQAPIEGEFDYMAVQIRRHRQDTV